MGWRRVGQKGVLGRLQDLRMRDPVLPDSLCQCEVTQLQRLIAVQHHLRDQDTYNLFDELIH